MGLKVGNIDILEEIIELHFQLARTQLLLDEILKNTTHNILPADIKKINSKALEIVQKKFPNMGIKEKSSI